MLLDPGKRDALAARLARLFVDGSRWPALCFLGTVAPSLPSAARRHHAAAAEHLAALDFGSIGWFRAVKPERASPMAVFVDRRAEVVVCVQHSNPAATLGWSWWKRLRARLLGVDVRPSAFVEFNTRMSDGVLFETSNQGGENTTAIPGYCRRLQMPRDTPARVQWEAHCRRTESHLRQFTDVRRETTPDADAFLALMDEERQRRNRFRRDIGIISDEELRVHCKQLYDELRAPIRTEIARLLAAQDESDAARPAAGGRLP